LVNCVKKNLATLVNIHSSIGMLSLKAYTLAGSEPGSSVLLADAMTTLQLPQDRCDIFEIFSPPKNWRKNCVFDSKQSKIMYVCKILIITLILEKKRQFFRRNILKIVIITSTPGPV
jgi:hypothetical protein